MKKTFLLLAISCCCLSTLLAQRLEVAVGANYNRFYDARPKSERQSGSFESKSAWGYSAAISVSDITIDRLAIRAALLLNHYGGKVYRYIGSSGGNITTDLEVQKTYVGVGLYPVSVRWLTNGQFNMGAELQYRVQQQSTGYAKKLFFPNFEVVNVKNDEFHTPWILGVSSNLSYDIKLKEHWYIAPQYHFYWGLTDEFQSYASNIKSLRHSLLIGIVRRWQ